MSTNNEQIYRDSYILEFGDIKYKFRNRKAFKKMNRWAHKHGWLINLLLTARQNGKVMEREASFNEILYIDQDLKNKIYNKKNDL